MVRILSVIPPRHTPCYILFAPSLTFQRRLGNSRWFEAPHWFRLFVPLRHTCCDITRSASLTFRQRLGNWRWFEALSGPTLLCNAAVL